MARLFPGGEKEGFVFADRAAKRAAELVEPDGCAAGRKEIAGIECGVLQRFEQGAVIVVGTGPGGHSDDASRGMPVFCAVVARDHLEFLHGIHRQAGQLLRPCETHGVGDIAPIENETLIAGASTGDTEHGIVFGSTATGVDHHHAWCERREG